MIYRNARSYVITSLPFSSEHVGGLGHRFGRGVHSSCGVAYDTDLTKPIGSIKTAWVEAKKRAKVECRFHDIRHTAITLMVEALIPLPKIAKIVEWSPSQTVRMSIIYSHFALGSMQDAMSVLDMSGDVAETVTN